MVVSVRGNAGTMIPGGTIVRTPFVVSGSLLLERSWKRGGLPNRVKGGSVIDAMSASQVPRNCRNRCGAEVFGLVRRAAVVRA